MRRVIDWAVRHPTIVNLLMVGVIMLGLASIRRLPKEVFPDTSSDVITVQVVFRGAGPREIETGILLRVEEATQGVAGIERITSEAKENLGLIRLEVARGEDTQRVLRDVKDQVEQISSFPTDAERPLVYIVTRRFPVITFALYGDVPRSALQKLADRVKDDLLALPNITQVNLGGLKEREIVVEVNEADLRSYKLQIQDVARILRQANLDLSGGTLRTPREDLIIRAYGKRYRAKEIEQIILRAVPGSTPLRLGAIARVRERFAETPQKFSYQGKRAVQIQVQRTANESALRIAGDVQRYLQKAGKILPPHVSLDIYQDRTVALRDRIFLLTSNGLQGLALVLLALAFLLNLRLSFWVAVGLPLSLVGSFILMYLTGLTINMISLFGLILVIGILVDDAIVVGENIYTHYERGSSPWRAAVDGATEVFPAVLASVTTTMLAFLPLFFMGGFIGTFIYMIPAAVIAALALSLFEAFIILPPHLAHALKPHTGAEYTRNRLRKMIEGAFNWVNHVVYARTLRFFFRHRWPVFGVATALLFLSIGLIGSGMVRFVFFPRIDADRLVARFTMKPGTPREAAERMARLLEKSAQQLNRRLKKKYGQKLILNSARWLGRQTLFSNEFTPPAGEEVGEVQLELLPGEERKASSFAVLAAWRKIAQPQAIPEVLKLTFDTFGTPPVGRALEFDLLSRDPQQLRLAIKTLKKALERYPTVSDVEDDLTPGKKELRFKLTPLAQSLGVTFQDVALALRNRFYGQEVMRLQRGRDEIRLFVRYPLSERRRLEVFEKIWITTRNGRIPLRQLASWSETRSIKVIRRIDRQRMAKVFANLDDTKTSRQEIINDLSRDTLPRLAKITPEVRLVFAGQGREQAKVIGGMRVAFPLALFGILFVLVFIFQSYQKSILVMSMIPFGFIGAIWGHLVMGVPFTILSFFGVIGLSGIVVNDSLVLMNTLKNKLSQGCNVYESTIEAGQIRLRAIVSTTITTVAGLTPLLLERSLQAQFLIPMAISIAFGVLFATLITLVVLPSMFLLFNDLHRFWRWLWTGIWPSREDVEAECQRHSQEQEATAPTAPPSAPSPSAASSS